MTRKIRERALKAALKGSTRYFIVAAGFTRKNDLLDVKNNIPSYRPGNRTRHAEGILMKLHGRKLKKIVIYRVGNSGEQLPIEPCNECRKLAQRLGIKIESL